MLDSNGSGGLTSQEFCAAMKKLVGRAGLLCRNTRERERVDAFYPR